MTVVWAVPGDPSSGLVGLKCSTCRLQKPLCAFPKSCAQWARGTCTNCNKHRARLRCIDPLAKKLESARVRFRRLNGVTLSDVYDLYRSEGLAVCDSVRGRPFDRTFLAKADASKPFSVENMTIRRR